MKEEVQWMMYPLFHYWAGILPIPLDDSAARGSPTTPAGRSPHGPGPRTRGETVRS